MIDPDHGSLALLDEIARVLTVRGYANPFTTPAGLRLRCLLASERLQDLGACPSRVSSQLTSDWLPGVVTVALLVLTLLSVGAYAGNAVEDAEDALRAVLVELG